LIARAARRMLGRTAFHSMLGPAPAGLVVERVVVARHQLFATLRFAVG